MNDLSTTALFVKVVESGSFSATARFLEMTPSAVSRQISQLESELGGRLFQRTTRKQSLTEAGEIYFRYAQRLLEELDAAKTAVRQLSDNPSGHLQVTAEADFALAFIQPVLPEFLKLYPNIQLSLHMSTSFQDLIDQHLDVAIRIGHLDDSSLSARKLADSRSVICASPGYLSKYGKPAHPRDLAVHNCLSFRVRSGANSWRFASSEIGKEGKGEEEKEEKREEKEPINVSITGCIKANALAFLRQSALDDIGIVMMPTWMIRDELEKQHLVPILTDFPTIPSSTPIHAVFPHKRQLAPKVRAFVDFLAEKMQSSSSALAR